MRTTTLVTISLPPALANLSEKFAKKKSMTRSELMRIALREYLEREKIKSTIFIAQKEKRKKLNKSSSTKN